MCVGRKITQKMKKKNMKVKQRILKRILIIRKEIGEK